MRRSEVNNMQIYLSYKMGNSDLMSISLLFQEMADNPNLSTEDIFEIGYNSISGYTYISLESRVDIVSIIGKPVEFLVTDFEDGTEYFLETYKEAEEKSKELDKINIQSFN
tara:strand:- start:1606 stop:1938 length:333 start_codon:yes stop_codon:yes gene_type:complete